jgi:ribosomal protein S18 acetylase RimI-like enzyme
MDRDSNVALRQATVDDHQRCVRCLGLSEASGEILKGSLESGECIVALEGTEMVGAIAFHTHFFRCTFISLVVVAAHARRRGVATALIEAVELRMSGKKLFTSTNQSNTAAQALFQRAGFIHRRH